MQPVGELLDMIVSAYCSVLQNKLVGIYVHGSLAMDCFNPEFSDIDLLVVVNADLDFKEKRELVDTLIKLSDSGPKKGFELSVLAENVLKHFEYPTPYLLQYSDEYRGKYEFDPDFVRENGKDPDLAAHIFVTIHRGICLFGKPIYQVFEPIPKSYYIKSIIGDLAAIKEKIMQKPVNVTLDMCRVLHFIKTDRISSKKEAGEWAYSNVPGQYSNIIKSAMSLYTGAESTVEFKSEQLTNFADYMLKEIKFRLFLFEK